MKSAALSAHTRPDVYTFFVIHSYAYLHSTSEKRILRVIIIGHVHIRQNRFGWGGAMAATIFRNAHETFHASQVSAVHSFKNSWAEHAGLVSASSPGGLYTSGPVDSLSFASYSPIIRAFEF